MERTTPCMLFNSAISQDWPAPECYDVLLSCARDTRNSLASHLQKALSHSRVQTFVSIDNDDGSGWDGCLKGPRIFIVLFSTRYGFSIKLLEELAKAMDYRDQKKIVVLPVFVDVEPSDVRLHRDGCFEAALAFHEKTAGNGEIMERWRKALSNAGSLKGWHLRNVSNGPCSLIMPAFVMCNLVFRLLDACILKAISCPILQRQ